MQQSVTALARASAAAAAAAALHSSLRERASASAVSTAIRTPVAFGCRLLHTPPRGGSAASTVSADTPSRTSDRPPVVPDEHERREGRSSEVASVRAADPDMRQVVERVFQIYEARDVHAQQRTIRRVYAPDAVYQNNLMCIQGHDALIRRFGLLPRATTEVRIRYEMPVVLGATTSAPDAFGNLAHAGDLEVEVKNTQRYEFKHPGVLRILVMPLTDVELPVLTRLALDKSSMRVLHHQDVWLNKASLFGPLRRSWGSIVTAASAASGTPVDKPGTSARRAHRGEDGEQSDADADADTGRERVGGGGNGGGGVGGQGGSGGVRDDEGLKRGAPGVEPVPA